MKEFTNKKTQASLLQTDTKIYSVAEVIEKYKALNKDMLYALEIIEEIKSNEAMDTTQLVALKNLNISFEVYSIDSEELYLNDDSLLKNILETIFKDVIVKTKSIFGYIEPYLLELEIEDFNKLLIRIGIDVTFLLKFFNELMASLQIIIDLSGALQNSSFNDELEYESEFYDDTYDFSLVAEKAMKIPDLKDRICFYHNQIAEKQISTIEFYPVYTEECDEFVSKCNQAIAITTNQLNAIQKINPGPTAPASTFFPDHATLIANKAVSQHTELPLYPAHTTLVANEVGSQPTEQSLEKDEPLKNPNFTTSRQALAIYYLLNEIDHKGINQIDRTEKARFIEFLTGKNYKNIYKALSNPFKGFESKNPKALLNDLEYIKQHFEKLGLHSIIQKIDNDMQE